MGKPAFSGISGKWCLPEFGNASRAAVDTPPGCVARWGSKGAGKSTLNGSRRHAVPSGFLYFFSVVLKLPYFFNAGPKSSNRHILALS